jgi:hypothetical protein
MRIYNVAAGAGNTTTFWPMARESGEVQQISFFMRAVSAPTAPLIIELVPSGGDIAAGDAFQVYNGTPPVGPGGTFLNVVVNGPVHIVARSGTSGAGGFVVFAQ